MNQFVERYKTSKNSDLLKIIESPNDYQPLAVEAAKNEITIRRLSDQELNAAKKELEILHQEKEQQTEKKKQIENKVKKFGFSLADTFNPIQQSAPTADKLIKLITIVFGGLTIYQFYKEFGMFQFMFIYGGGQWDFSMVLYFLPLIILPVVTFLFWKRKKIGWTLLAIFLTYSAVSAISLFFLTLNLQPSGIAVLDNLRPSTSPTTHLFTLAFFGGTLWVICKNNIREIYGINKKTMVSIISATTAIIGLITFSLF